MSSEEQAEVAQRVKAADEFAKQYFPQEGLTGPTNHHYSPKSQLVFAIARSFVLAGGVEGNFEQVRSDWTHHNDASEIIQAFLGGIAASNASKDK